MFSNPLHLPEFLGGSYIQTGWLTDYLYHFIIKWIIIYYHLYHLYHFILTDYLYIKLLICCSFFFLLLVAEIAPISACAIGAGLGQVVLRLGSAGLWLHESSGHQAEEVLDWQKDAKKCEGHLEKIGEPSSKYHLKRKRVSIFLGGCYRWSRACLRTYVYIL